MAKGIRILIVGLSSSLLFGCQPGPGLNRVDALGMRDPAIVAAVTPLPSLPVLVPPPSFDSEADNRRYRDSFVEQWMARSDDLCREYKDKIILISRDTRLATDATRTVLSGLATVFTPISTVHALSGAATIVGGVGAAADADVFQRQSGEIIASAIQTARHNQANQIEKNLRAYSTREYSVYRAQRDVVEFHNMCSLETGLAQIRASLRVTSPDQGITPPAAQGRQRLGLITVPEAAEEPNLSFPGTQPAPPPAPPPPASGGKGSGVPASPTRIEGALNDAERAIDATTGRKIEAALCLSPDRGIVSFGSRVRDAIRLYRGSAIGERLMTPGGADALSAGLNANEIKLLTNAAPCRIQCYANPYEYFQYGPEADRLRRGARKSHLDDLHELLAPEKKDETIQDFCVTGTRTLIATALTRLGEPQGTPLSRTIILKLELERRKAAPVPLPSGAVVPGMTPAPAPANVAPGAPMSPVRP